MLEAAKVWSKLNPDYEIKLYDNKMCEDFLLENYSNKHKDIFNYIKHGQIKADYWRVCIINKFGGIYVDSDIMPLVPLDNYIENHIDFCTCISSIDKFNPQIIMSKANEEILEEVIDKYMNCFRENKPYDYWDWSICRFLTIGNLHIDKTARTCYYNGKKIQLLLEINTKKHNTMYCVYNNKRVLNNKFILLNF
jgi:mannosyltransferase OCH1-like enzyme